MASFAVGKNAAAGECFQFDGPRELVNAERALELLSGVSGEGFKSLNLSDKSYDEGAAKLIGDALHARCALVTVANISDIIAGRQEDEAQLAMKAICDGLADSVLEVVHCDDNAMGPHGVRACAGVIAQKSLKYLSLMNDGLSAASAEQLTVLLLGTAEDAKEAWARGISAGHAVGAVRGVEEDAANCPPLRTLHFHNNMTGEDGAASVARLVAACSQLRDFRFSTTRSQRAGCLHVAKALQSLAQNDFTALDLSDNSFGGECSAPLNAFLSRQRELQHLVLRDSGLNQDGMQALVKTLQAAGPPLQTLDLSGNDAEAEDGHLLAAAVRSVASTLRSFQVDDNCLESEGMAPVAVALRECKELRVVHANNCELSAAGAYRLARTLCRLPHFERLEMDGNMLCARGVHAIEALFLKAGKTLAEMEENDDEGDDDLDEALEDDEETAEAEAEAEGEGDAIAALEEALEKTQL